MTEVKISKLPDATCWGSVSESAVASFSEIKRTTFTGNFLEKVDHLDLMSFRYKLSTTSDVTLVLVLSFYRSWRDWDLYLPKNTIIRKFLVKKSSIFFSGSAELQKNGSYWLDLQKVFWRKRNKVARLQLSCITKKNQFSKTLWMLKLTGFS